MKILVLGANGQLATALVPVLEKAGHAVVGLSRAECDLTDGESIDRQMALHRPGVVVNTAAYNQVDRCETESDAAFQVNGYGPRWLALSCERQGAQLVHVSTNYVFDGRRSEPYGEASPPNPLSSYGLSKLAGECCVRRHCRRHLIIRTCGLFGRRNDRRPDANFVERIMSAAAAGRPLRIVNDQVVTPTYTGHLAPVIAALIAREATGLYHVTNSGWCTWWEFARAILDRSGGGGAVEPISSKELGAPAERPAYSVLRSDRLSGLAISPLPDWREGLETYFMERVAGRPVTTEAP